MKKAAQIVSCASFSHIYIGRIFSFFGNKVFTTGEADVFLCCLCGKNSQRFIASSIDPQVSVLLRTEGSPKLCKTKITTYLSQVESLPFSFTSSGLCNTTYFHFD